MHTALLVAEVAGPLGEVVESDETNNAFRASDSAIVYVSGC
jgi:hypothetical protein